MLFGFVMLATVAAWAVLQLTGCSGFDAGGGDDDGEGGGDDFADDDNGGSAGDDDDDDNNDASDDDDDDDSTPPPPEPEEDVDPGTRPRICDGAVFVLSTDGDFVSRIAADTLAVTTIAVGAAPTVMRATDDCAYMVVLNSGDDSASVIAVADNSIRTLPLRPGLNELKTAPGGRYALAYHYFDGADDGGTQGFGEISIVNVRDAKVQSLAVGFPPEDAVFTQDERAVLVSATTLALVNLTNGAFASLPTGLDIEEGQKLKKVAITADGAYALLLAEASTSLLALKLADNSMTAIELGCFPTDLAVAAQGDVSLLVCRQTGQISVIDNRTLALTQHTTDEVVGSAELTADGRQALLFTNAEAIEKVHVFATANGALQTYLTVKPLIGAAIAPGDQSAVLFHYGGDNQPIDDIDRYFDRREAFSAMNLSDGRINPVEVPETPLLVSFGDDGRYGVIPLPGHNEVVLVDLTNGLADALYTPSRPTDVGVIAEMGLAFALQQHDLGRITFFDVATRQARTITGFLLNGQIGQ
jgi:DNA-binding beta-propeller fold protein YncE